MVRTDRRVVGDDAEQLAFTYLRRHGLQPVARNFRCRHGEIDLIMQDVDCLVFVEVRYRSSRSLSGAAMTVDARKQRKLARAAAIYLAKRRDHATRPARFDVVGIDRDDAGNTSIEWLQDAFWP